MKIAYGRGILATLNVHIHPISVYVGTGGERLTAFAMLGPRAVAEMLNTYFVRSRPATFEELRDEVCQLATIYGEDQPIAVLFVGQVFQQPIHAHCITYSKASGVQHQTYTVLEDDRLIVIDRAIDGFEVVGAHTPGNEAISPATYLIMKSAGRAIRSPAVRLSVLDGPMVRSAAALDVIERIEASVYASLDEE